MVLCKGQACAALAVFFVGIEGVACDPPRCGALVLKKAAMRVLLIVLCIRCSGALNFGFRGAADVIGLVVSTWAEG